MKIRMRIYRRDNGYWYYEIERNQPKSLKTKNERKARQKYNRIKKRYLAGKIDELDGGPKVTLAQFKEKFFELHTDIDDDTHDAYDLAIRLLIDSIGGSTRLSRFCSFKLDLIGKFKQDCLTRSVKKVSVNTYLRHIRGFLYKAHDWGYISVKPKIIFYKLPKRHPRTLTKDEEDILLLHSFHCHFQMHRVIKFALWTGCRREEIYTLTWQQVKNDFCTVIGKGDKERTIPLVKQAWEALGTRKDIGPVFWQPHIDEYSKAFKRMARDCEIEDISLHKTRHTAATNMLASGMRIEYVQAVLGHADISTTQIYADILQERLKAEMKKYESGP